MFKETIRPRARQKPSLRSQWFWPSLLLILSIGILSTVSFWVKANYKMRGEMLDQAHMLSQILDMNKIQTLTGTPTDLENPEYLLLKEQLADIKQINDDFRFIYLMGRKTNGPVFFFVDNEPKGSLDESPPGQVYEEISADYLRVFNEKKATLIDSATDRWGTWVSALVPMNDPQSGEMLAVLGLDMDATHWRKNILSRITLPLGIVLSLLTILTSVVLISMGRPKASAKPVQRRLLIPLSLALLLLGGGFCLILLKQQHADLNLSSKQVLREAVDDLEKTLQSQTDAIMAMEEALLSNIPRLEMISEGDRDRMLSNWQPVYKKLHATYGITHFYFHNPDGINLLRVHKPEKYGDVIDRFTLLEAMRTDQTVAGIELGPLGTLSLRVVHPIYHEYSLIGYLELGKEIEDILEDIHADPEIEVAVSIHKHDLDRKQWEEGMAMLGREPNWDYCDETVLIYSSLTPFPFSCSHLTSETEHTQMSTPTEIKIEGKPWHVLMHPLLDASGTEVGDLIILKNISRQRAALIQSFATVIPIGLFILVSLMAALYIALHRTDTSIQAQQAALRNSEERLVQLAKQSNTIIWEVDAEGLYTYISEAVEKILGYKAEEMIGKMHFYDLYPEEERETIKTAAFEVINQQETFSGFENRLQTKSGEKIWMSTNSVTIQDHNGKLSGYRGSGTDITIRKRAEEERADHLHFLENMARIDSAIQQTTDIEQMMTDVLQATLEIFESDRAWLLYPCDPSAKSWCIPMMRTRPEYPQEQTIAIDVPMHADERPILQTILNNKKPLGYGDSNENPLPERQKQNFGIRSQLVMALYPKTGKPWALGLHQCSRQRTWTKEERELFCEISHRLTDALSSLLFMRDLRASEKQLQLSNRRWNAAQKAAKIGNWELNIATNEYWASEETFHIYGIPFDEENNPTPNILPQEQVLSYLTNKMRTLLFKAQSDLITQNKPYDFEFELTRQDNSEVRIIHSIAIREDDENRNPIKLVGTIQDITTRKRTDTELKESQKQLLDAQYIAGLGGFTWDILKNKKTWSDGMYRLLKYDKGDVLVDEKLNHPDDRNQVKKWLMDSIASGDETLPPHEHRLVCKDGEIIHVQTNGRIEYREGKAVKLVGTCLNITARKQAESEKLALERQIQHGQKLESLGVLAGGIAHDFNNILMAVLGYADLAIEDLSETHPALSSVREIEKGAKRAAELTRQMLAYSGKGHFIVEEMNVSTLMDDMAHLLRTTIPKTITLNLNLDRTLPPIKADVAQMQQIVMNLITNAAEAIGNEIGTMTLSTGQQECTREYLEQSLIPHTASEKIPQPGIYVYFEVTDTGCGMNEETLNKLFEPFFSTKFTGRGLGMAAVLGIVHGHSGAILLDTQLNQGSTFRILFPAAKTKETTEVSKTEPPEILKTDEKEKCGTILVVDDEEVIRDLTTHMLQRQGFAVLTATDGRDAINLFRKNADEISCVVLDLTMPIMGGEACFEALRKIKPDIKVILASGYSEQELSKRFANKGLAGFIQKPFVMATLMEKLA